MRRSFLSIWFALTAASVQSAFATPLEIKLESPAVVVTVPGLEGLDFGPHPSSATQPSARLFGQGKNGVTVSVLVPTAGSDTPASQCASWLAGNVLSRFAPSLDSIQIIKAGDNAYVLIFPFAVGGIEQLKAFVLTGSGKGHCVEVHMSRLGASKPQRDEWLNGFRDIQVQFK